MIISMRLHASKEEVQNVCARIEEFGYRVHSIEGEERVVIGVVGVGQRLQAHVAAFQRDRPDFHSTRT